jgi:hypothetical protein
VGVGKNKGEGKRRKGKGEGSVGSGEKYMICKENVRQGEDEERKVKRERRKVRFGSAPIFSPAHFFRLRRQFFQTKIKSFGFWNLPYDLDTLSEVAADKGTFAVRRLYFFVFRDNFTNFPQTLSTFADIPLTFKNSHLSYLNFQKFSLTPLCTN